MCSPTNPLPKRRFDKGGVLGFKGVQKPILGETQEEEKF